MDAEMSDREWIKANPGRRYRTRRTGVINNRRLVDATVVKFDADGRGWSSQNITMRAELADDDAGAERALAEYELMEAAQTDRLNGQIVALPGATVIDAVLAKLRSASST